MVPCVPSSCWPPRNATNDAGVRNSSTTTAYRLALAHSTGRRLGTAAKVARTIPVPYSPLISRTPSTPTASWAMLTPPRLRPTGSKRAISPAGIWLKCALVTAEMTSPRPASPTTAASSVSQVERSVRIFTSSERTTLAYVGPVPGTVR